MFSNFMPPVPPRFTQVLIQHLSHHSRKPVFTDKVRMCGHPLQNSVNERANLTKVVKETRRTKKSTLRRTLTHRPIRSRMASSHRMFSKSEMKWKKTMSQLR
uniref:Uncharacterized protein n=1 Tax=Ditylenchus dipsaci TaxID=166011 RepID=A0A915E6D3_9BILA